MGKKTFKNCIYASIIHLSNTYSQYVYIIFFESTILCFKRLVVAGGVGANQRLRKRLTREAAEKNFEVFFIRS